jgi:uncharacterized lipoprotein YmbA
MTRFSVLAACCAGLAACAVLAPTEDRSRFFTLASAREIGTAIQPCSLQPAPRVGLGPITLPEYLDQPALVSRASATEVVRSRRDRWSETMDTMLPRILGDDFAQLLPTARIVEYPWYASERPDWQIEIEVARFEPDVSGDIVLVARWRVRELAGRGHDASKESRVVQKPTGSDATHRTEAMSAALTELAQEIASELCRLASAK